MRNRKNEEAGGQNVKSEERQQQRRGEPQIANPPIHRLLVRPFTNRAGRRRQIAAAAMSSERAELARLCSTRNWSKAIRLLDSVLARSPSSIHDLWYGTLSRSAGSL